MFTGKIILFYFASGIVSVIYLLYVPVQRKLIAAYPSLQLHWPAHVALEGQSVVDTHVDPSTFTEKA